MDQRMMLLNYFLNLKYFLDFVDNKIHENYLCEDSHHLGQFQWSRRLVCFKNELLKNVSKLLFFSNDIDSRYIVCNVF